MRWLRLPRPLSEAVATVALGLAAGAVLMLAFGYHPLVAYRALAVGAFGSVEDVLETLAFATPLMLTALTFAVGVRAGLFNIGAEGQMYLGAIGATFVAGMLRLPPGLHAVAATAAPRVARTVRQADGVQIGRLLSAQKLPGSAAILRDRDVPVVPRSFDVEPRPEDEGRARDVREIE
jgi:hypothetical protein